MDDWLASKEWELQPIRQLPGPMALFAGEGSGIVMSETEGFSAKGLGVGKLNAGKFSYRGALTFRSGSPNLSCLNGTFGVFEYEQDISSQEVSFICYEWK